MLNNGNMVTVGSIRDVIEVVSENMSYELGKYLSTQLFDQEILEDEIDNLYAQNEKLEQEQGRIISGLEEVNPDCRDLKSNNEYFDYLLDNKITLNAVA
jgi:hypothetical protein